MLYENLTILCVCVSRVLPGPLDPVALLAPAVPM